MGIILANQKVYINGYDRSGVVNQISLNMNNDVKDSTALGDLQRVYTPGLNDIEFSSEGFYDVDVDGILWDSVGVDGKVISFYESGAAANAVGYAMPASILGYAPGFKVAELKAFRISAKSSGKFVKVTTPDGIVKKTSTGNGTARELGAVSATQKVFSFVHVIAKSGTNPTLVMTIASDSLSGFTSPITQITHTQFTDIGSEVKSANGAITDTWWRVTYTLGGSSPSFDVIVGIGIV